MLLFPSARFATITGSMGWRHFVVGRDRSLWGQLGGYHLRRRPSDSLVCTNFFKKKIPFLISTFWSNRLVLWQLIKLTPVWSNQRSPKLSIDYLWVMFGVYPCKRNWNIKHLHIVSYKELYCLISFDLLKEDFNESKYAFFGRCMNKLWIYFLCWLHGCTWNSTLGSPIQYVYISGT